MNKWDKEENKDDVRYSVIINEMGIKIVDLISGKMDYASWDGKAYGGIKTARDFRQPFLERNVDERKLDAGIKKDSETLSQLSQDKWTAFYNRNFTWKEYCESELGIKHLDDKREVSNNLLGKA